MTNKLSFLNLAKQSIKDLKDKEQYILMSYFGIQDKRKTLEAIGQKYGITRERVRQIKNNAILKVQKNADENYNKILSDINKLIKNSGGVVSEELLSEKVIGLDKKDFSAFIFSLHTNAELGLAKETACYKKLWVHN